MARYFHPNADVSYSRILRKRAGRGYYIAQIEARYPPRDMPYIDCVQALNLLGEPPGHPRPRRDFPMKTRPGSMDWHNASTLPIMWRGASPARPIPNWRSKPSAVAPVERPRLGSAARRQLFFASTDRSGSHTMTFLHSTWQRCWAYRPHRTGADWAGSIARSPRSNRAGGSTHAIETPISATSEATKPSRSTRSAPLAVRGADAGAVVDTAAP